VTYDLIFLDPPYRMLPTLTPDLARHLPALLAPAGRAVLESDAGEQAPVLPLPVLTERAYGGTRITVVGHG
jgi:16S rRNA G966 N2-methylase RsmD